MLNRVEIMGRLTSDPELRATRSGAFVTSFSIATESDYKNPQNEKVTDFFEVVAWRNTAEFISKHFTKGKMIVLAGRLKTETWVDNDEKNRKSVKIVAESVYFGDSKKDDGAFSAATYTPGVPDAAQTDVSNSMGDDDDLPF